MSHVSQVCLSAMQRFFDVVSQPCLTSRLKNNGRKSIGRYKSGKMKIGLDQASGGHSFGGTATAVGILSLITIQRDQDGQEYDTADRARSQ